VAADEQHDDGLGGRSRYRREVSATGRFGAQLVEFTGPELDGLDLPETIREAVDAGRKITSFIARKRQIAHIDSLIRLLEDEEVEAMGEAIAAATAEGVPRESAADAWTRRLLEEGDPAIDDLVDRHADADRQQIRQLVRNAKKGGAAKDRLVRHLSTLVD
jgi:ribosome-associated protein